MANEHFDDDTLLDTVYLNATELEKQLALQHDLPVGTRFYGDVGSGYLDYRLPDFDYDSVDRDDDLGYSGQIFDERFKLSPAQQSEDGTSVNFQEWDPDKKQAKADEDSLALSSRPQGDNPATIANAAATVVIGQISIEAQAAIDSNNKQIAELRELNEQYKDSWNPYQRVKNVWRDKIMIAVSESQNADLAAGRPRSWFEHILNDGVTAAFDNIFEGMEGLVSAGWTLANDYAKFNSPSASLEEKLAINRKYIEGMQHALASGYDAVVNKAWFPETREAWNAGLYGKAMGGIAPEAVGVFAIARGLSKKLAEAVAKGTLSEAEAAALKAGKIDDGLRQRAQGAGLTDEEIKSFETAKPRNDGETILGKGAEARFAAQEAEAKAILKREQDKLAKAHFLDRHGADTTLEQQLKRAQTGIGPDGSVHQYGLPNSSRFFTHQDQLVAMQQAMAEYSQFPRNRFDFDMGRSVGEGFLKGAKSLEDVITTTRVRAVFRDGKLYTMFPLLR